MSEETIDPTQVAAAIDAPMFTAPFVAIARVAWEAFRREAATEAERRWLDHLWADYMAGTGKFARFGPL